MNLGTGFFGSRDFKTADSFFVWKADATIGPRVYDTYFLLNGAPSLPALSAGSKWGIPRSLVRDAEIRSSGTAASSPETKNRASRNTRSQVRGHLDLEI